MRKIVITFSLALMSSVAMGGDLDGAFKGFGDDDDLSATNDDLKLDINQVFIKQNAKGKAKYAASKSKDQEGGGGTVGGKKVVGCSGVGNVNVSGAKNVTAVNETKNKNVIVYCDSKSGN